MTRTTATNYTGTLQFPYATAGTDLFHKEDVQTLALAVDQHNHTTGKGLALGSGSISNGTITSAMIQDGAIMATDIGDGQITAAKIGAQQVNASAIAPGAIGQGQLADGAVITQKIADSQVTRAKLAADARVNVIASYSASITFSSGTAGSWVVTPLTCSGTVAATGGPLLIMVSLCGLFNANTNQNTFAGIGTDGTFQFSGAFHTTTGTPLTVPASFWWWNPGTAAGAHTWAVYLLQSGGTMGISNQASSTIMVMQLTQ